MEYNFLCNFKSTNCTPTGMSSWFLKLYKNKILDFQGKSVYFDNNSSFKRENKSIKNIQ